jgi:hypothetical protein
MWYISGMETKKTRQGFYIDLAGTPELAKRVRVYAAEHDTSIKNVTIEALTAYLNKSEYQRSAMSAAETLTDKSDPKPE